jgi:hypothetical protein
MAHDEESDQVSDSYYERPTLERKPNKAGRPRKERPPEEKPNGRPKGSLARKTTIRQQMVERFQNGMDITPLEVMLRTMIDLWQRDEKIAACAIAEKAAPYLHPKLSSIQQTVEGGDKPIQVETQSQIFDELMNSIELIARTRVLAAEQEDDGASATTAH